MEEYKGYIIEVYWLPLYATFCFYKKGECETKLYTADSIEQCKLLIDDFDE